MSWMGAREVLTRWQDLPKHRKFHMENNGFIYLTFFFLGLHQTFSRVWYISLVETRHGLDICFPGKIVSLHVSLIFIVRVLSNDQETTGPKETDSSDICVLKCQWPAQSTILKLCVLR